MTGVAQIVLTNDVVGGGGGGGGGYSATMTVGSTEYDNGFFNMFADGFSDGSLPPLPAFGGLAPLVFNSTNIKTLWWESTNNHSTGGDTYIVFDGNRTAGFLVTAECNAVSLGAIGSPVYDSGTNTTSFKLGGTNLANPFGTSGTKTITLA